MNVIIHGDSLRFLKGTDRAWHAAFIDPPDNIGLKYDGFSDCMSNGAYESWIWEMLTELLEKCPIVWMSFNAKHTAMVGYLAHTEGWHYKPCVQTFTFGQHNKYDLGNNHRPLWRFSTEKNPQLYPEAIKVESWRQKNGDKRAAEGGKVPGDVFDFPRVTGNSKQRRPWHVTQLHEDLVERCLKLTVPPGGMVLDPCAGTGTTLRVCKKLGFGCTLIERSEAYFNKLIEEHPDVRHGN